MLLGLGGRHPPLKSVWTPVVLTGASLMAGEAGHLSIPMPPLGDCLLHSFALLQTLCPFLNQILWALRGRVVLFLCLAIEPCELFIYSGYRPLSDLIGKYFLLVSRLPFLAGLLVVAPFALQKLFGSI